MEQLNRLLNRLAHDYLLIAAAAVLFFTAKAIAGYIACRHYNRKLARLDDKLDRLLDSRSDGS